MAYAVRYTGELTDHFNRVIRVDVLENDFIGSSTEVVLTSVVKEWNGSDDDLFIGRIGSVMNVGFLNETNFQFVDLYSADSRRFKMNIYKDDVLDWKGWIIPDLFTEKYDTPPYTTIISARDGLGELDSIAFEEELVYQQIYVLVQVLASIDAPATINVGVNVFEENQNEDDSPLLQTYVDCARYEGLTKGEVLDDLLNNYNARIYQQDGEWWFVRVPEFESEIFYYTYKVFNPTETGTKDTELLIGRPQEDKFANVDQQLNFLPAWKSQNINIDLELKESFIKNYEFQDWTITGYVTQRNPIYEPDNWLGNAEVRRFTASDLFMFFTSNNSTPTYFRNQTIEESWKETESPIVFNVSYAIQQDVVAPQAFGEFWIKIVLSGTSDRWLNDLGGWETVETFINIQDIPQSKSYDFKKFSATSDGIPLDGEITVYIYASDTGNLGINEFKGELLTPDRNRYPADFDYDKTVNVNNNYIPSEIKLITADFQDVENDTGTPSDELRNEKFVYVGGFFLDANKDAVTQKWQTKKVIDNEGFVNADKLQNIIFNSKSGKVSSEQWAISGTILSKNIKIDSTIIDYQVNNKKYLVCNGTYDMCGCFFNGSYIEIGSYSGAPWILGDPSAIWNDGNDWDDNGQWVDNVEETIELSGTGYHNISAYVAQGDTITVLPNDNGTPTDDELRDGGIIDPIDSVPYEITNTVVGFVADVSNLVSYTVTFDAIVSDISTTFTVNVTI